MNSSLILIDDYNFPSIIMEEKEENESFEGFEGEVVIKPETVLSEPKMYRVIMHNDHYTTMEFVVEVLMKVFHKTLIEATKIMLDIHKKGAGICGVFTYDIAVTKIAEVHKMAKKCMYPLKCSFEEA